MKTDDISSTYMFSDNAKRVLEYAIERAKQLNSRLFHSHYLLFGVMRLRACKAWDILAVHGVQLPDLNEKLQQIEPDHATEAITGEPEPSGGVDSIIVSANNIASKLTNSYVIYTEHILLGILAVSGTKANEILSDYDLISEIAYKHLETINAGEQVVEKKTTKKAAKKKAAKKTAAKKKTAKKKTETVTILGHIEDLGLEPSPELNKIIPLAWHAQQHRSAKNFSHVPIDTIVSRPSLLYAVIYVNKKLRDSLGDLEFALRSFIEEIGLGDFSPEGYTEPLDFKIDLALQRIFNSYKAKFKKRVEVDSLALAYGILGFKKGRFAKRFESYGGDFDKARAVIKDLIEEKDTEKPPPEARLHSDKWTTEDKLDYGPCAKSIYKFLTHPDTSAPLVVGIQAPWGQGKTSLMKMIQERLDPNNPDFAKRKKTGSKEEKKTETKKDDERHVSYGELKAWLKNDDDLNKTLQKAVEQMPEESNNENGKKTEEYRPTVWFNAWKFQSSEEIWAGLAHTVLSQLTGRLPNPYDRELFWLKLQLKRIDTQAIRNDIYQTFLENFLPKASIWLGIFIVSILVFIVFIGTNMNASVISLAAAIWGAIKSKGEWIDASTRALEKKLEGSYSRYVQHPDYSQKMGYLHLVEEDMNKVFDILIKPDQPLVIFIDDLDRCSPTKIGQVIEAVNLFMSGNYPDCLFVFGIDAQVVAAAMEVVHKDIIDKLTDREDELGWRFMDKFIQLPFVISRLSPDQRMAFLEKFIESRAGEPKPPVSNEIKELKDEMDRLHSKIKINEIKPDKVLKQYTKKLKKYAESEPQKALDLRESLLDQSAEYFTDKDSRMLAELKKNIDFLSDNPRTIKRAINLYRFHHFMSIMRSTSHLELEGAEPDQITIWSIILIRWPHFVRWLQKNAQVSIKPVGKNKKPPKSNPIKIIDYVVARAKKSTSVDAWTEELENNNIKKQNWAKDSDLWQFLRVKIDDTCNLNKAPICGLW
ncbi:MAG: hypothetical protein GY839_19995 [candidate division Zixibacteria bacterium]|nr:hypothetical protein [candidate division Zixibacteria bacterium]